MMHFLQKLRTLSSGKPVGFKLCIGQPWQFMSIVKAMLETKIVPDFIVVDGSEGGTGAAPIEFSDNIGTPLREGLRFVHNTLVGAGLRIKLKLAQVVKSLVLLISLALLHSVQTGLIQHVVSCLQLGVFRHKAATPTNALWV